MAPVIRLLKKESWAEARVLATAQHRHLLDEALNHFNIEPDVDLDIMRPNQALSSLTSRLLLDLDDVLCAERPDVVLMQGDTTTVMSASLACFYRQIPFGHVEAGLRTWNVHSPFPEEANRMIVGRLAKWHFAPTSESRINLLREGIQDADIYVTGNTVIDALLLTTSRDCKLGIDLDFAKRLVLVTCHRRENFGQPFHDICRALATIAKNNPDIQILYPVHPNPNVKNQAHRMLGNIPNVILCLPLNYPSFVSAMTASYIIVSDSGGVQEEAPALGKPVLVLRDETERPEAVHEKVVKLIGTNYERIVTEVQQLLDDETLYREMARGVSPYGDGYASERIVRALRDHLQV